MAVTLSTARYEEVHKKAPAGSHYWRFSVDTASLSYTLETDGPFREAKERALQRARTLFGVRSDTTVEVLP